MQMSSREAEVLIREAPTAEAVVRVAAVQVVEQWVAVRVQVDPVGAEPEGTLRVVETEAVGDKAAGAISDPAAARPVVAATPGPVAI